jgi:hypothetical protein
MTEYGVNNPEEFTMNRTGENSAVPERSKRYYAKDGYWYYATREGVNIGPFDTLGEAERGVSDFIDFIMHAEPEVVASLERYGRAA